jgi:hypothetical protein
MERLPETCTDVQAALPLYVGSDLEPMEQASVEAHLTGCAACSGVSERAQAAREVLWTLRDRENEKPAPHLWGGIRAQLVSEGLLKLAPVGDESGRELSRPSGSGPRTSWRWRTVQLGGLAAAAALALFVGLQDRTVPRPELDGPGGVVVSEPLPEAGLQPVANGLRRVGSAGSPMLLEAEEFPAAVFPIHEGGGSMNALTGSESTWTPNRPTVRRPSGLR